MKILFSNFGILDEVGFGRSFMLARELANLDNEVLFLTTLPSHTKKFPYSKEIRDGVVILALFDIVPNFMRRTGFGLISFFLRLYFIFTNKFDIYHADIGHRPSGGIAILLKKLFFNIIYISEWYNYYGKGGQFDKKRGFKKYTHGIYDLWFEVKDKKFADGIVCLSAAMAKRARSAGIPSSKICVINGGSDVKSIMFSKKSKFKNENKLSSTSLVFVFAGMAENQFKEIIPFINALNELIEGDNRFNDCFLLTTGQGLSEEIKQKYLSKITVLEFGWVDYSQYSKILNAADFFVFLQTPTLDNNVRWPNRLGDYMAAGRKTIINPYGETVYIINKHEEPFLNVQYSKDSIKEKLLESIKSKSFIYDREKIREIAMNEVSWTHKGQQLLKFYNDIYSKE